MSTLESDHLGITEMSVEAQADTKKRRILGNTTRIGLGKLVFH